jgi:RNA polymerase sigma factor (sigma-70 family)
MATNPIGEVIQTLRKTVLLRDGMTDVQLLEDYLCRQDEAALASLIQRYAPMVWGVCRRVLGNHHDAEDAFQATFLVFVRKATSISNKALLANWLYGVARQTALKARSTIARKKERERQVMVMPEPAAIEEKLLTDLRRALDQELGLLPQDYRAVIVLCDLEDKTRQEAARCLGCPEGTIASRLARARTLLAKRLARHGLPVPLGALAVVCSQGAMGGAPPAVVHSTIKAATLFAAGQTAAGAVSLRGFALAEGVLKAMLLKKLTNLAAVVLLACLFGLAASAWVVAQTKAESATPTGKVADENEGKAKAPAREPKVDRYGDPLPDGAVARLGTVRWRHDGPVYAVAYSRDGKRLASAGFDGIVRLWEPDSGKEIRQFKGHLGHVRCLAFSPDGKVLASSGDTEGKEADRNSGAIVRLWDVVSGNEIGQLNGHSDRVHCLAFAAKGKILATGGNDQTHFWDWAAGKQIGVLDKQQLGWIRSLAFTPDDGKLVVASEDGEIVLWELARDFSGGKAILRFTGHRRGAVSVALSRDGKTLFTGSHDNTARMSDVNTGKTIREFKGHEGWVNSVALSPDGKLLATGSEDWSVGLWDVERGIMLRKLTKKVVVTNAGNQEAVHAVAFSPDGKTLAVANNENRLRLWDVQTGKERFPAPGHESIVIAVAYSPDGKSVVSASHVDRTLRLWDLATSREVRVFRGHDGAINAVAFSPDGKRLASAGAYVDESVRTWDVAAGKQLHKFHVPGTHFYSVAFSPNNKYVAAAGDKSVWIWHAVTGQEVRILKGHTAMLWGIALSPDGKMLASAGDDCMLRLWSMEDGSLLKTFPAAGQGFMSVAFAPDSKQIVTGGIDKMIRQWEVNTGKEILTIEAPEPLIRAVAFSPDGKSLVSSTRAGPFQVWDPATGKQLRSVPGHISGITSIAFSPGGRTLATGSFDNTVLIWDATRWRQK